MATIPSPGPMYFGERAPAPDLRLHVAAYWCFRVAPGTPETIHTIPPDGCASVFVHARHRVAALVGPQTEPQRVPVHGGDLYWGARIAPGAAPAFVTVPPTSLRNRSFAFSEVGLESLAPILFDALSPDLDEEEAAARWDLLLPRWLAGRPETDRAVTVAALGLAQAHGEASITEVAAALGLSPRQFRRRFGQAVGLSPKEFARVRRVRSSLATAVLQGRQTWTTIAADQGFSDQAHLVREIRRLSGLPPGELRSYLASITHGAIIDR